MEHHKAVTKMLDGDKDCKPPRLRDRVRETEVALQRELQSKKGGRMLAGLDFLCAQAESNSLSALVKSLLRVD